MKKGKIYVEAEILLTPSELADIALVWRDVKPGADVTKENLESFFGSVVKSSIQEIRQVMRQGARKIRNERERSLAE